MIKRRLKEYPSFVIVWLIMGLFLTGCTSWSQRGAKGVGTLPSPSPHETNFSPFQPAHPYQQLSKGLLGRKVYAAPVEGTAAEVHDFLVGPGQRSESYTLRVAAIFEVKSGTGLLRVGDKPQKIETGTVVSVPAMRPFSIENQSEIPIAIRVDFLGNK